MNHGIDVCEMKSCRPEAKEPETRMETDWDLPNKISGAVFRLKLYIDPAFDQAWILSDLGSRSPE